MNAIHDLMLSVEEEASYRNHEVIAAILRRFDLDKCCVWSRVLWHLRALERRICKVNWRIRNNPRLRWYGWQEKLSLHELNTLKDDLTRTAEDDRMSLNNLEGCGTCPGCKYTPKITPRPEPPAMKVVLNPADFTPIFIAEGAEGE